MGRVRPLNPDEKIRTLAGMIRKRVGTMFRLCDLTPHCRDASGVVRRLLRNRLARVRQTANTGKGSTLYVLTPPNRVAKSKAPDRWYRYPVGVAFVPGQKPEPARSALVPAVGRVLRVKTETGILTVKFVGTVPGGWFVQPVK